jgi:hypothetical protein
MKCSTRLSHPYPRRAVNMVELCHTVPLKNKQGTKTVMEPTDKEPKFIKQLRRNLAQEAEGRPDAATYEEAGNAALNMVLAHWLATPSLNPSLVREEATKNIKASYEDKLQRAANKLAKAEERIHDLERDLIRAKEKPQPQGPLLVEDPARKIRSLEDKVRQLTFDLEATRQANQLGIPLGKKQIKAREANTKAENLKLHQENRELKRQLAELQNNLKQ